ncbi:MAG: DPP IV N-terminal domain-containing protein [Phycisphaerae bacterium]
MRTLGCLIALMGLAGCTSAGAVRWGGDSSHRPQVIASDQFLKDYAATRRFSAGRPTSIRLTPDGQSVLFLRSEPRSFVQDLYEFDTQTGNERLLLTVDKILAGADELLSVEERARRERMRISARGIVSYRLSKDGAAILVPLSGKLFVIDRSTGHVQQLNRDFSYPIDPKFSPDGKYISCVRDSELFITEIESGRETQLTFGATENVTHARAEFVAQEEMGRYTGYWWSPKSDLIVFQQTDTTGLETMYIADAMHPEREPQSWPYPRPGKKNAKVSLALMPITGGSPVWINWDHARYPYLASVKWNEEKAPLTLVVQNRTQTEEAILAVDLDTGSTSVLLVERDDAWINLDQSVPRWLPDGSAFLWTTERNGARQLELRRRDGSLVRALTPVAFRLTGIASVYAADGMFKEIYLRGSDDPTQSHVYRLLPELPAAGLKRITWEPGLHGVAFSKNHKTYVHSFTHPDGTFTQTVHRADGSEIGRLRSNAQPSPIVPNVELTTVGSDPTFHAAIIRPRNFDASRRYPVILSVYAGPHAQVVRANPMIYLRQQWFADHGFVVVSIDGRGTPARGRAWERVIKGNLIQVAMDDQVAGLKALGEQYPELDLKRLGVYGWSFGGYFSAMAVLMRPDVFRVAVAGAPVTDWLDYDTHYTERYMGLPEDNPEGYKAASALTYADELKRPLLLIHGTADDNVYFKHSLNLANALFRAGKAYGFLPLSDFTHMVAEPEVTVRLYSRMIDYFIEHLYD